MTAYEQYRATGGTLARDAFYVQALHQTAGAINIVVQQPVSAARDGEIRRLWSRFSVLANEYRSAGATERSVLDLINRVSATVEAALRGIPSDIDDVTGAVARPLAPLLWPLAIVAGIFLYIYIRERR